MLIDFGHAQNLNKPDMMHMADKAGWGGNQYYAPPEAGSQLYARIPTLHPRFTPRGHPTPSLPCSPWVPWYECTGRLCRIPGPNIYLQRGI